MSSLTQTTRARGDSSVSFSECMSAVEACVIACCEAPAQEGHCRSDAPGFDALVCVQLCDLALHALREQSTSVPAVCTVCAHACEELARSFMLLSGAEYRWSARACYRAAQECRKLAVRVRAETAVAAISRSASVYQAKVEPSVRLAVPATFTLPPRRAGRQAARSAPH